MKHNHLTFEETNLFKVMFDTEIKENCVKAL